MIRFARNSFRDKKKFHSSWVALVIAGGLISIFAFVVHFIDYSGAKWYQTEQDITVHLALQDNDIAQKLKLRVDDFEFVVDTVDLIQRFPVKSRPKTIEFTLKTLQNDVIRIDSLRFSGADDIHYYIRRVYKEDDRLEANVDLFEFHPF